MAKDKFSDYDSTAANNTDVGGVGIQGTNVVSNFDNGLREIMSHIADHFASDTIASATTTDLGSKSAHYLNITGTTTITGLGTVKAGTIKFVRFSGALTLTHNATSLILPGAANITTAAGDTAIFVSEGSGNWRCLTYRLAAVAPAEPGVVSGFRNKIINGDFPIWQRNTSFTATGYTADRWKLTLGSGAACTVSRQSHTVGQTDVPGSPQYFLRFARGTAGSAASHIQQSIESVRTLANKTATVTFWAKAAAATELKVDLIQSFGTGGSPSSDVTTSVVTAASITTSWQKFSYAVSVPSISGKTLGSNENDIVILRLTRNHDHTNPTTSVDISHVSIVQGDATGETDAFSARDRASELMLCERYFQSTYPLGTAPGTVGSAGSVQFTCGNTASAGRIVFWQFRQRLRSTSPTMVIYSSQTGTSGQIYNATAGADKASSVGFTSDNGFSGGVANIGDVTVGDVIRFHYTADAEF